MAIRRHAVRTAERPRLRKSGEPAVVLGVPEDRFDRLVALLVELKDAARLSSAGVAQNLRRMLDRGQVREEPLPGGATGYRIADNQTAPSASGAEGETG